MLKAQIKSIPKSILIICLLILLFSILIVIAWKPLRVLNLQSRGGEKIEDYILSYAPEFENYFTCQLPALTTLPYDDELAQAVTLLEKAKMLKPENAQTYLLLGRAYCLQRDYEGAIEAFEEFSRERPENPLGALESAFANFTWVLTAEDMPDFEKSERESIVRVILEGEGYSGEYFLEEGDAAFNRWTYPAYPIAWYWYQLSEVFSQTPGELVFRKTITDLVFSIKKSIPKDINNNSVFSLDDSLTIPPSAFFRLFDGTPVSIRNIEETPVGVYFRSRDPGGVLVDVKNSGNYCLTIKALDRPPEPTLIEITLDLNQLTLIELLDGDGEWKSFDSKIYLDAGLHLLGIRLANDRQINGVDRNGHIGEITIQNCEN